MDALAPAYLAALQLPGMGSVRLAREVRHFGSLAAAAAAAAAGAPPAPRVPLEVHRALARLDPGSASQRVGTLASAGVGLLPLESPGYPRALLGHAVDPPALLYLRGTLAPAALLPFPAVASVAVVGARRASAQGTAFARSLAEELAERGVCVVSGLALGIDAAAHEGALSGRGATVAVLGSGHDRLHPPANRALAERIVAAGGALLSAYPPEQSAQRYTFPRRNRLISGLARAVAVVEAGARSGALITAGHAAEQGRDVFAAPGRPRDPRVAGCLALLRDGAALLSEAADLLASFPELPAPESPDASAPRAAEASGGAVWRVLADEGEASLDLLAERTGVPAAELLGRLTRLELAGRVERTPAGRYRCRGRA